MESFVTDFSATYCLSVPLFVHFSFSPMESFVTDFSAPIGASVLKMCVHLQVGQVYCVNELLILNILKILKLILPLLC